MAAATRPMPPRASRPAQVVVRPYEPADHAQVCRVFSTGLMGLWTRQVAAIFSDPLACTAGAALGAAAGAACRSAGAGPVATVACAALALLAPPAIMTAVTVHATWQYVQHSLHDDLAQITTFYADSGAGPGSAFWVAELVEGEEEEEGDGSGDGGGKGEGAAVNGGLSSSSDSAGVTAAPAAAAAAGGTAAALGTGGSGSTPSASTAGHGQQQRRQRRIVGSVALQRLPDGNGELRRMSVAPGLRRLGVGTRLVQKLLSHAAQYGMAKVVLTTSCFQIPALHLYHRLGWSTVKVFKVPDVLGYKFYSFHYLEREVDPKVDRGLA